MESWEYCNIEGKLIFRFYQKKGNYPPTLKIPEGKVCL